MTKHGIPCPRVIQLRKHVLLMSFIGRDRVAAPKLKDAKLSTADLQIAYDQILQVCMLNFNGRDQGRINPAGGPRHHRIWG